jgi:hypothetical protein
MKNYIELESGYIQYEENGVLFTIPNDLANSDYQAYLNKDKAQDEAETI